MVNKINLVWTRVSLTAWMDRINLKILIWNISKLTRLIWCQHSKWWWWVLVAKTKGKLEMDLMVATRPYFADILNTLENVDSAINVSLLMDRQSSANSRILEAAQVCQMETPWCPKVIDKTVVGLEEDSAVAATTEATVMDSLTSEEEATDLPETNSTTVEGNKIGNNLSTTTVDRISTKEDKPVWLITATHVVVVAVASLNVEEVILAMALVKAVPDTMEIDLTATLVLELMACSDNKWVVLIWVCQAPTKTALWEDLLPWTTECLKRVLQITKPNLKLRTPSWALMLTKTMTWANLNSIKDAVEVKAVVVATGTTTEVEVFAVNPSSNAKVSVTTSKLLNASSISWGRDALMVITAPLLMDPLNFALSLAIKVMVTRVEMVTPVEVLTTAEEVVTWCLKEVAVLSFPSLLTPSSSKLNSS